MLVRIILCFVGCFNAVSSPYTVALLFSIIKSHLIGLLSSDLPLILIKDVYS